MAEDFADHGCARTMQFKAMGMADGEHLEIRINGAEVPIDYITRVFDKDGQSVYEGDPLPAFHEYTIDLNWETTGREAADSLRRQRVVCSAHRIAGKTPTGK